jgi:hypothetical protein
MTRRDAPDAHTRSLTMARKSLKIVPNNEPESEGIWIQAEFPSEMDPFDFVNIDGHHVVNVKRAEDPNEGFPMGTHFPLPPARSFSLSWLGTRVELIVHENA